jgi:hypothetical protein
VVIQYLHNINDGPKKCQQCTIEASYLVNLLINLRYRLEQAKSGGSWYTAVRVLNVENGPLDQYNQALEQLLLGVESRDGLQKVKRRLLWKFSKAEVASILARMERLKSLIISLRWTICMPSGCG